VFCRCSISTAGGSDSKRSTLTSRSALEGDLLTRVLFLLSNVGLKDGVLESSTWQVGRSFCKASDRLGRFEGELFERSATPLLRERMWRVGSSCICLEHHATCRCSSRLCLALCSFCFEHSTSVHFKLGIVCRQTGVSPGCGSGWDQIPIS
jgi:hypothetical protein